MAVDHLSRPNTRLTKLAAPAGAHTNGAQARRNITQPRIPFPWWKRVRVWRLAIATAAAAIVLWIVSRYVVLPVCLPNGMGLTNMRSTLVRSPQEGTFEPEEIELGTNIDAGQRLAILRNDLVDDSPALGLATRSAVLEARLESLAEEKTQLEERLAAARASIESYRGNLVTRQQKLVLEMRSALDISKVEHLSNIRKYNLERVLIKDRVTSADQLWSAYEASQISKLKVNQQQSSLERTELELSALQKGVFLEGPPSGLQLEEQMSMRLVANGVEAIEASRQLESIQVELAAARKREDQLAYVEVRSPMKGVIIRRMVNRGPVPRHEPLFEIAERDVFVEALIHQRWLDQLTPDGKVIVNVTGGPMLCGTIRGVRSSGSGETEPSNVNRLVRRADQVCVLIDLDSAPTTTDFASRHCEVLIIDRQPTLMQRAAVWIFSLRI